MNNFNIIYLLLNKEVVPEDLSIFSVFVSLFGVFLLVIVLALIFVFIDDKITDFKREKRQK